MAYQTAWLKAHYPAEYMAALLTSVKRDKDRTALYLSECRAQGIRVQVPDVNRSDRDYAAPDGVITFGLSAVRNVGEGVADLIIQERRKNGEFLGFQDFIDRVDTTVLNKRTVESLVKAGAFDSIGHTRKGLMLVFEQMVDATLARRRAEDMGQYSLFGADEAAVQHGAMAVPGVSWDKKIRLGFEKEMLGLYVSDHPLLGVEGALGVMTTATVTGLWDLEDGAVVTIGGIVAAITRRYTRAGEPMLYFQLEDLQASVEVVAFPRMVAEAGPLVQDDAVLVVTGRLDHRGDDIKVIAQQIRAPELDPDAAVRLKVQPAQLSRRLLERLQSALSNHPGTTPVFLHMLGDAGRTDNGKVIRLGDQYRVERRSALFAELREVLGPSSI